MRLYDERYEELKNDVVNLFQTYCISCTPISGFEVASKMRIRLRAYSSYTPEDQEKIIQLAPDGCSCLQNGIPHIFYNDSKIYTRQNWTIMHEIAHLYLKHTESSDVAEAEANFFAKFALVPPVLVQRYNLSSVSEIMERFQVGYEAAYHALEHCQRCYCFSKHLSQAEQKLCILFKLAV